MRNRETARKQETTFRERHTKMTFSFPIYFNLKLKPFRSPLR